MLHTLLTGNIYLARFYSFKISTRFPQLYFFALLTKKPFVIKKKRKDLTENLSYVFFNFKNTVN